VAGRNRDTGCHGRSGILLSETGIGVYLYACFKRACFKQGSAPRGRFIFKRKNGQCLDGEKLYRSNARGMARSGSVGYPMSDAWLMCEPRRCAFNLSSTM